MRDSFGDDASFPGRLTVNSSTPADMRGQLKRMGYTLDCVERSSGPINAIFVDLAHGTLRGGLEQSRRGLRHRLVRNRRD
jgi:gamma-glutamyltranspeptidase / glutathione hydrolase